MEYCFRTTLLQFNFLTEQFIGLSASSCKYHTNTCGFYLKSICDFLV